MIEKPLDILAAEADGRFHRGYIRRAGPAMPAGAWGDLSYAAGIPSANYYAATPLRAAVLAAADGIDQGPATTSTKILRRMTIIPPSACGISHFRLQDTCLYYPFIDGDGGTQSLSNPVAFTRYNNGEGCQIMAVVQGVGTGQANVAITYTNSDGVTDKVTSATLNFAATAGQLASSCPVGQAYNLACGPYIPLCTGCRGVRSIQSIDVLSAAGGIVALVIVKPIACLGMFEAATTPIETDFYDDCQQMPTIEPDAYLNLIMHSITAATPATVIGRCDFIWGA
jgi:hypothetical protein